MVSVGAPAASGAHATASAGPADAGLVTPDPVVAAGSLDARSSHGAVHLSTTAWDTAGEPATVRLEAERIQLAFAWENGTATGPPTREDYVERTTSEGTTNPTFHNVQVRVENGPVDARTQLVAFPEESSPRIRLYGAGESTFSPTPPEHVTRVGKSPKTTSTNDSTSLGFWYEPDDAWLAAGTSDHAIVEGDFSLFLNNATATVSRDGEQVWQNWTGYRQTQRTPLASQYERHQLFVHVTDGQLKIDAPGRLAAYAPRIDLNTTGVVTTDSATGRLALGERDYAFDNDPLQLEGTGRLTLAKKDTPEGQRTQLALAVRDGAGFSVEGRQPLEPQGSEDAGGVPYGLVAVGLVAVVATAHQRDNLVGFVDNVQEWRYSRLFDKGRASARRFEFEPAAQYFRRASRVRPSRGRARYEHARALAEAGRPGDALDVVDAAWEADAVIDEADLLELEAAAAHRTGEDERCRKAIERLAERSQPMAASFVHDLKIGEDVLGPELASRLLPGGPREDLPGYA